MRVIVTGRHREQKTVIAQLLLRPEHENGKVIPLGLRFCEQAEQCSFLSGALDKLRKCLRDAKARQGESLLAERHLHDDGMVLPPAPNRSVGRATSQRSGRCFLVPHRMSSRRTWL